MDDGRIENKIPDIHGRIQDGSLGITQEQRKNSSADRTQFRDHTWVAGGVAGLASSDCERYGANSFGTQRYGTGQARDQTTANTKWVSDFSYIDTAEGWLYLAIILDLLSRKIVEPSSML